MKCPCCGAEMTRHAKKVVSPRTEAENALVDEALGGIVLECHACPGCGESASRVSSPP